MPRRDGGYNELAVLRNQAAAASPAPVAQTPAPATTAPEPEPAPDKQGTGFSIGAQGGGGLLVGLLALGIGAAVEALGDKKAPTKLKPPTP